MNCEEVIRIAKRLDKLISGENIEHSSVMDLLKSLQELPMCLDVLQKTRIGMTVNNLRKQSANDEVITLSKMLIKNWRKLLPADSSSQGTVGRQTPQSQQNGSQKARTCDDEGDATPGNDCHENSNMDVDGTKYPTHKSTYPTTDCVRLKCRQLMRSALESGKVPDGVNDLESLSSSIEHAIFQEFNNTDTKYRARVRSRIANMKDQKNPNLRLNVLIGLIPPEKIACMSSEEMASKELKELREKLTKEAIDDHQMTITGGTTTSLLKCGKCGKNNCTYNQVQTRSADEPMTIFVVCNECGNRWKFEPGNICTMH